MIDAKTFRLKDRFSIKTFGNSMWPLLQDGDIIHVNKSAFSRIKVNDIICARYKDKLLTHRVIFTGRNFIVTKGDNNVDADGRLYKKNYLGTVTSYTRNGQKFHIDDVYLFQSSFYFKEITKILRSFRKNGIRHLILKGLPLHLYLQKKIPRRIYADCDVLIDKRQYKKAERVLNRYGYTKAGSTSLAGKEMQERAEVSFFKNVNGIVVVFDLHLEVVFLATNVGRVDVLYPQALVNGLANKFLKEKKEIKLENEVFFVLSNENLLVYLFLHLFNHNFKGVYRYDLICFLLTTKKIEFDKVKKTVKSFALANFIYPGIVLLDKYFNTLKSQELRQLFSVESNPYINQIVDDTDIFSEGDELGGGKHFGMVYKLSPQKKWIKPLVFANRAIMHATFYVLLYKVKRILLRKD